MDNVIVFRPDRSDRRPEDPGDLDARIGSLLRSLHALSGHVDHAHAALRSLLDERDADGGARRGRSEARPDAAAPDMVRSPN